MHSMFTFDYFNVLYCYVLKLKSPEAVTLNTGHKHGEGFINVVVSAITEIHYE